MPNGSGVNLDTNRLLKKLPEKQIEISMTVFTIIYAEKII